jgi:hypothetical protein
MKTLLKLITLMIFSTQMSYAAVLIEPYLGYKAITDGEEGTTEYDTNGVTLGGRLGYQQLGLMGGIDFNTSSFDLKKTTNTATTEQDASSSDFGLFVGYNAPILVRVWISYYLNSNLDFKNSTESEYKGSGYALGVGYTGFPFLSLNFEYKQKSYDELETSTATSNLSPEADFSEVLLSVSLPLSF